MNSREQPITLTDVRQCLERSGYLMESRLVRALSEAGYFVEPNQCLRDPRTGKSREIDLVAEYYKWNPDHHKVSVRTTLVVEAINNKYPFVLLTERPNTPNADFESYVKFIHTPDPSPFLDLIDFYADKKANWESLFSQYCALTAKNNKELMASHSDDVYGAFQKMSEYIESEIDRWNSMERREHDEYWRLFFWTPVLVLSGQLITASLGDSGIPQLTESKFGRLEFNWHANDERRTTVIEVLTEDFLIERLASIRAEDERLEAKVRAARIKSSQTSAIPK